MAETKGPIMKILVLQHAAVEHPGIFRDFLREDGHSWHVVELDEGEVAPPLDGFDALWVMGGPMDVWQEDEFPWLKEEKRLIQDAVQERGMPFLGLCLGHQLLAEALGGAAGPAQTPEIGVLKVMQTEEGAQSVILDGLPMVMDALQWHSAEVTALPEGAKVLMGSPDCAVQAMSWGPRAFSAQFHIEIEADTVENWAKIPAYHDALVKALGDEGAQSLKAECDSRMSNFEKNAERLYINWLQTTARV